MLAIMPESSQASSSGTPQVVETDCSHEGYQDGNTLLPMTGAHGGTELLSHDIDPAALDLTIRRHHVGSTSLNGKPAPPLPTKLLHQIFVLGAAKSLDLCKQLCLVCSWVRLLVLPLLMPIIGKKGQAWLLQPESMLRDDWISPNFFTKYLWFTGSTSILRWRELESSHRTILSRCPNLVELALPGWFLRHIPQGIDHLIPHVKYLYITTPFHNIFRIPSFTRITKLTIRVQGNELADFDMSRFPSVTHLTLYACGVDYYADIQIDQLLAHLNACKWLKRIAFHYLEDMWNDAVRGVLVQALKSDSGSRLNISRDDSSGLSRFYKRHDEVTWSRDLKESDYSVELLTGDQACIVYDEEMYDTVMW